MARWNVTVSDETDRMVRVVLASRGGKKGDLSKFIEEAVSHMITQVSDNAGLDSALIKLLHARAEEAEDEKNLIDGPEFFNRLAAGERFGQV